MAKKICIYAFAAWNPPPEIYTHKNTEAYPKQPALEGGVSCLTEPGEEGGSEVVARCRRWQKAHSWRAVRASGSSELNYLGWYFHGEPAWEPPQSFPRQRMWGRIPFSSLRWLKYPLRLNNKHEHQQINETSRILSPAKCLFSSVFPRARGSPAKLEQRDFKFGKNLGNRSSWSANCHSSTEVSRDMTIYTHLGSATG